jgi:hypothetical protein
MNIEEKLMYVDLIKIMVKLQCTIQNPNFIIFLKRVNQISTF